MENAKNHNLYTPNPGQSTVKEDFKTIEWCREANASWRIGRSSNPVFFTSDGHNAHLEDYAKGSSVIITDGFEQIPARDSFIWQVGNNNVNNTCDILSVFRNSEVTNLNILKNPRILKLMPLQLARNRRSDNKFTYHSPNCFYFRRHSSFNPVQFFTEETIWNDGNENSDVLSSIQLAIVLGFRKIFVHAKIDHKSKAYQHLQQIIKNINNDTIAVKNCGNIDILPKTDINKACQACVF